MIPKFQVSDFVNAFLGLTADWLAWAKDSSSVMYNLVLGLAPTHFRVADTASNMVTDSFPQTTTDLIDVWQASLGLPDPLIPVTGTEQNNQIVSRFVATGGASVSYWQEVVGSLLGIAPSQVEIFEFFGFLEGFSRMGYDAYSPMSNNTAWIIKIPSAYSSNVALVIAEVGRIAPAHSTFYVQTY